LTFSKQQAFFIILCIHVLISFGVLQHPCLVSIAYAPLSESSHRYYGSVASALSLRVLIMLIPSCLVVHRSMRLVLNAYCRHSLEL